MSYLLIVLILFVALAPLMAAMPSRRQRRIADLRQTAAATGLFVQLRKEPWAGSEADRRAYYGRLRNRDGKAPRVPVTYRVEGEEWLAERGSWGGEKLALLRSLPAGISAVCEDVQGAGVYWDERGTREEVREIDRLLRRILAESD